MPNYFPKSQNSAKHMRKLHLLETAMKKSQSNLEAFTLSHINIPHTNTFDILTVKRIDTTFQYKHVLLQAKILHPIKPISTSGKSAEIIHLSQKRPPKK